VPSPHLRLLTWEHDSGEERDVHLCRECEVVLWRRHHACPSCRAQTPAARTGTLLLRTNRTGHERLAVAVAVAAPLALFLVDEVLHWLLAGT
jgi:hypothetical protein